MGYFIGDPKLSPLLDGKNWQVREPFSYFEDNGNEIIVPAGFITDFASVPPLARFAAIALLISEIVGYWYPWCRVVSVFSWVVIVLAEWLENSASDLAAVVHDLLYHTQKRSRVDSDWVLFKAMGADGAAQNAMAKRILFFVNVRLFGWKPWRDDAREIS